MLKLRPRRRNLIAPIIGMIVGAALIVGVVLAVIDYLARTRAGDTTPTTTVRVSTDAPSEEDPGPVRDDYTVPAHEPRSVQIPTIDVHAYVQKISHDSDGVMTVPSNIHFAGWYVEGVAPGESGLSIINGHEGGRYAKGVFERLHLLSKDQVIRVQMGDLSWREFAVVSVESFPVEESASALFADSPAIDQELRLITCGGTYNSADQTYDQRVIVVAERLN